MRIATFVRGFGLVALMAATGCKSLDITNPNDPDGERALSDPEALESFVGGASQVWFNTFVDSEHNMAGSSLLTLIDDIATILDDVAVMSKVAAKKTAGVLGDDLALNAQQVAGVKADRELPVVFAVMMGSLKNKVILVPAALAISAFIPWAVTPLLMIGGAYLCYEGFEKLAHKYLHSKKEDTEHHHQQIEALANAAVDMVAFEKDKIRGAIRTDFI